MHKVVYSCFIDFIEGQLGTFTQEIFSVNSQGYRDGYFSIRKLLCSMCLVCSSWRYHAERTLQRRIILRSKRGALSFTKNCRVGPWIRELYLEPIVIQPFEEDNSESSTSDSDTGHNRVVCSVYGHKENKRRSNEDASFLTALKTLTKKLLPKLRNLHCFGISMRHYHPEYSVNGCILDLIKALQYVPHLKGLFLIDQGICPESETESFLVPLCHRIAQLHSLSHLWISNFGLLNPNDENLPSALQRIKPPSHLKSIGFDVPNARLQQAVLSWLVTPRDNYAPECIVASVQNNNDLANNDLVRVLDHAHTITCLHLDFTRYSCNASTIDLVSSVLSSLSSLRDLHIGYELAINLKSFPSSLTRLWLTFLHPYHSDWYGPGSIKESICDNVSLGQLPNLKKATFCVLFSTGGGEIDDLFKSDKHPLAIALRERFGIEADFEKMEIFGRRRLLADTFGCPI